MDIDNILKRFPKALAEKLDYIDSELKKVEDVISEDTQKDFAALILSFMDSTNYDEVLIMRTSYLIFNAFRGYSFDYRIESAMNIFSELQIPTEFQEGREFDMWDKARSYLLKYLDNEDLEFSGESNFLEED